MVIIDFRLGSVSLYWKIPIALHKPCSHKLVAINNLPPHQLIVLIFMCVLSMDSVMLVKKETCSYPTKFAFTFVRIVTILPILMIDMLTQYIPKIVRYRSVLSILPTLMIEVLSQYKQPTHTSMCVYLCVCMYTIYT